MSSIRIPLHSKKYPDSFAVIDGEDDHLVSGYHWMIEVHGRHRYAYTVHDGTRIYMHRLIAQPPSDRHVDHINGDGLDNRQSNLRHCTSSENQRNRFGLPSNNTSGYLGVSWFTPKQRWRAHIRHHGQKIHLGYFDDPIEAAIARDFAAVELQGDFVTVNFPIILKQLKRGR